MKLNRAYKPLFQDALPRFTICYGGAGSGKSYAIAQKIIVDCFQGERRYLVLRKVAATLKDSVFQLFVDILQEEGLYTQARINHTDKAITIESSMILCKGLDDPEKIKSIQGITDCWIEEASELKQSDFEQLNLRLRGAGVKRRYILSFNPIDEDHWLKKRFFDEKTDDIRIIHSTYHDNAFLDDEYISELESYKERDPYYYDVYCLGEWGSVSGLRILRNVSIERFEIDQARRKFYGLDFGFHDPNAAIECYIRERTLFITREWYENQLDPVQMIDALKGQDWLDRQFIVCDSARPELINMMKAHGFMAQGAKKKISGVKDRRYKFAMAQFLSGLDSIVIHADNCPNAAREFPRWSWASDRDGNAITGYGQVPEDGNDHTIDALVYALEREAEAYYRKR